MNAITLALLIFGVMLVLMAVRVPIAISMFVAGATGYVLKDSSATEIVECIRTLRAGGSPVSPVIAKPPAAKSSPRSHGNKNIFGHFVDVAREWLPAAMSAALNEKALGAKTSNPEMGFMKHFKRIAEIELPRTEFDRIDREASRRDGSMA